VTFTAKENLIKHKS